MIDPISTNSLPSLNIPANPAISPTAPGEGGTAAHGPSFDSRASLTSEHKAPAGETAGATDFFEPIRRYEQQSDQTEKALQEFVKANPSSENAQLLMLLHDSGI